ncbi:MAG: hypothetical protein LBH68_07775 [Bifidobacteriaceae bacterium]|nr:hypothetical protein [Bifidobacteriaceae bacterium]
MPDLQHIQPGDRSAPWAYTAVDEEGKPVEVVFARTNHYLIKPPFWRFNQRADVTEVSRIQPLGVYELNYEAPGELREYHFSEPADGATVDLVTADSSVFLAGLRPSLFRPNDGFFISMAMAIETALVKATLDAPEPISLTGRWKLSAPVAINLEILGIFRELNGNLIRAANAGKARSTGDLDRTDLLCAATAVLYGATMYTTRPGAYEAAGEGLKLLKYGPVRNKGADEEALRRQELLGWGATDGKSPTWYRTFPANRRRVPGFHEDEAGSSKDADQEP